MKAQALLFRARPQIDDHLSSESTIVVHKGDSLEFLQSLPSETIALIVTSPPYNIGKEYETRVEIGQYLRSMEPIADQLARILRSDGSICWQVGNFVSNGEVFPLDVFFYDVFKRRGMRLRNRVIWHFGHGLHAGKRFSGRYETILWFTKTDKYVFNLDSVRVPAKYPGKRHFKGANRGKPSGNPNGKNPSDVWEIVADDWERQVWNIPNVKANHPEKTSHPCQFPIELVERCVLALTKQHDWVLDPFCGVGSSLVAAIKHDRRAIGCDREAKYIGIVHERIRSFYDGELKMRPLGKPIFVPTGREKVSQVPQEWQTKSE